MQQTNEMPSGEAGRRLTDDEINQQLSDASGAGRGPAERTLFKPGRYPAKPVDWGFSTTKEGLPQAMVLFEFAYEGSMRRLAWFGSFKENSQEITLKALITCGCRTINEEEIAAGVGGKALDATKEVSITIGNHMYNGKTSSRIEWVNEPGGGGLRNSVAPTEVKKVLPQFGAWMKTQLQQAGLEAGAPAAAPAAATPAAPPSSNLTVPF